LFSATALCFSAVLAATASVQSEPTAAPACPAPNVRTDVRPNAGGPPTTVSVGIRVIDLMEINDIDQMLTGDLAVRLRWIDPRLTHLAGCEVPLDDIWSPGLVFVNSGRQFPSRPKEVGIGPDGQVT
jgi:hypothetical protein